MFNISGLLEKFQKQIQNSELTDKKISDVITQYSGIICSPEVLEVKNYILYINVSPTLKNKILMTKKEILNDLLKISSVKIVDIR